MMRVNLTKEEFMHQYASKYYDPVKAHEYYERTKKLKGRSTSGMSDEQKKTWRVVKDNVMTEKKQETEQIKESSQAEMESIKSEAAATRQRISEKLKAWLEGITKQTSSKKESLSETAKREKERIQAERQRKLDALPTIPRTASPAQKERMRITNAKERDSINKEAKSKIAEVTERTSKKRSDISDESSDDKSVVRESASQERKVVSEKLKTAIGSVREKVKEIKEALNASTEDTLDREYENIMSKIAGKAPKAAKGKKSKSSSGDKGKDSDAGKREKFIADNLARLKSKR